MRTINFSRGKKSRMAQVNKKENKIFEFTIYIGTLIHSAGHFPSTIGLGVSFSGSSVTWRIFFRFHV